MMIIPPYYKVGLKEHMKLLHQLEYEIVKPNVLTQNPFYYPLDVSDCNMYVCIEVVACNKL